MMKEFLKKFAAIVLMFIWVFSGYPGTFFNKIQPVYAATNDSTVEVLGGGGGGGVVSGQAGGGGGGGEYHRCTETLSVQSYTVTVGAGGSADANPNVETDSIFSGTGISVTADGGGGTGSATAGTAGTGGDGTRVGGQEVEQDMEASEEMVLSQFRVVVAEAVEAEVRVGQGKTQVPQQAVRLVSGEAEQVEMLEPVM